MTGLDWTMVGFITIVVGIGLVWFVKAAYSEDESSKN